MEHDNLAKRARGKVSGILTSVKGAAAEARKRASRAAEDGNIQGARLFQQLKATAGALTPAKRNSTSGSGRPASFSSSPGDLSGHSPGSASSSRARPAPGQPLPLAGGSADNEGVAGLCRLGFSPAAARHALEHCHGRLDDAGEWLLDGANADEILAAELQAQVDADSQVAAGCVARITSLRAATHLNGLMVAVLAWDETSDRWIVETPSGDRKAIRPRNLERVQGPDSASAAPADSSSGGGGQVARSSYSAACPAATPEEDPLAGFEVDDDLREVLAGLSPAEVHELLGVGGAGSGDLRQQSFAPPPRRPPAGPEGQLSGGQDPEVDPAELQRRWEAEEERRQLREAEQLSWAQELESQEAELERTREVWRSRTESEAQHLEALESQCAKLETDAQRCSSAPAEEGAAGKAEGAAEADHVELQLLQAEVLSVGQELEERRRLACEASEEEQEHQATLKALGQRHAAELAECEAELSSAAAQASAEASGGDADTGRAELLALQEEARELRAMQEEATAAGGAGTDAQRAELRALQEEVQRAARDLAEQRELARTYSEDHELRLLERELEHRRVEDSLREESAKIERQRRSTLALQVSALKMMDGSNGETGAFQKDEDFGCARAKLDVADDAVEQDADSEVWDVDWTEWSRTHYAGGREEEAEEEEQPAAEGEPGPSIAGDVEGDKEAAAAGDATLPMSPRRPLRLAPGSDPEESEEDCSLQDSAVSSPPRPVEAASPETPGAPPPGEAKAVASPPRAEAA